MLTNILFIVVLIWCLMGTMLCMQFTNVFNSSEWGRANIKQKTFIVLASGPCIWLWWSVILLYRGIMCLIAGIIICVAFFYHNVLGDK
jgi:hypothetical protein